LTTIDYEPETRIGMSPIRWPRHLSQDAQVVTLSDIPTAAAYDLHGIVG
jgi:hypothetical protein